MVFEIPKIAPQPFWKSPSELGLSTDLTDTDGAFITSLGITSDFVFYIKRESGSPRYHKFEWFNIEPFAPRWRNRLVLSLMQYLTNEPNPEIGFTLDLDIYFRPRQDGNVLGSEPRRATAQEDYWFRRMLMMHSGWQEHIRAYEDSHGVRAENTHPSPERHRVSLSPDIKIAG